MDHPAIDLSPVAMERYLALTPPARVEPAQTPEERGLHPLWWAAIIGGQLADALTTTAALKTEGAIEGNPFMRGVASRPRLLVGVKLGAGTGLAALTHRLHRTHPTGAKGLAAAFAVSSAVVSVHNARIAGRQP